MLALPEAEVLRLAAAVERNSEHPLGQAVVAAALAALRVMRRDASLFDRLWQNVAYFKAGVERLGYQTLGTATPIIRARAR